MQHPISICNIQMKQLKYKSETTETLKTQRRRWPQPTWWGTPVASKFGSGGRLGQWSNVHPRRSVQASPSSPSASPTSPSATSKVDGGMVRAQSNTRCGRCGGVEEGGRERDGLWSRSAVPDSWRYGDILFKKLRCLKESKYRSG